MDFHDDPPAGDLAAFDRVFDLATAHIDDQNLIDALAYTLKEALGNVRKWSYKLDPTIPICINIHVADRAVIVTIVDSGEPWRENGYLTKSKDEAEAELAVLLKQHALSGRGELMMNLLCDSVCYLNKGRHRILAWRREGGHTRAD